MRMTRSEVRKQQRLMRARRRKKLLLLNGILLLAILLLIAVWNSGDKDGGRPPDLTADQMEEPSDNNSGPSENEQDFPEGNGGQQITPPAEGGGTDSGNGDNAQGNQAPAPGQGNTTDSGGNGSDRGANNGQSGKPGGSSANASGTSGTNGASGTATPADEIMIDENKPPLIAGSEGTVTLAFVGDVLLGGSVGQLMEKHGFNYPYAKASAYLKNPDLTAANLENPITTRGTPADKSFVFKGSPKSVPALTESGIDVVSLANNHTLDMGVVGLLDTIGYLDEAGMPHTGGGSNEEEAYEPVILEAKGIKVAYVGVSRVLPVVEWKAGKDRAGVAESYDTTRGIAAVKKAKERADIVIVMIHWGIEKADFPEKYQSEMGRKYIDAGADLVIGSHPHVLQGFEPYKGKWIAYSLGNFIFNMTPTLKTRDTGVLNAVCTKDGDCSLQFNPMLAVESQPTPLQGEEAKKLLAKLSGFSINAVVDQDGNVKAKRKK